MDRPRLHLIAPAGSCRPFLAAIDVQTAAELIAIVQDAVGTGYVVTGDEVLIQAGEDESLGGRDDDRGRAGDIERALADDGVAAIVLIRGGAWFSRVLGLIDFSVLDSRAKPVAVFGFSELTTLVNIVASHHRGIGVYDMGPAFLVYGLRRHAMLRAALDQLGETSPKSWARARLIPELKTFFRDVVSMIEGRGTERSITARLVGGDPPSPVEATFVGGNLTVLSTLVGSRYKACIDPAGRWLMIEDFNDKIERIDRFLAHITLADLWEECEGILVGNFHRGDYDVTQAVVSLLEYHIPRDRSIPILVTGHIGHIWPMSPLPLNLPVTLEPAGEGHYSIHWPASAIRTV